MNLFPGLDTQDLWGSGSAWSRQQLFPDHRQSHSHLCEARRRHSAALAQHGVCPLCYKRMERWRAACAVCDKRLVRLQVPSDMVRHGLVPLTGNRIPASEVGALPHPPPLWRGEHHVRPPRLPARVPPADTQFD